MRFIRWFPSLLGDVVSTLAVMGELCTCSSFHSGLVVKVSRTAVSVHVVINASCPHARLLVAPGWGMPLWGEEPATVVAGVVGARRGPWVSSGAALGREGRGQRAGQPRHLRRGPGEALGTPPTGQWEMDPEWQAHAWISEGARVCSDQWGRSPGQPIHLSDGHLSGLGGQCRNGEQALPSTPPPPPAASS